MYTSVAERNTKLASSGGYVPVAERTAAPAPDPTLTVAPLQNNQIISGVTQAQPTQTIVPPGFIGPIRPATPAPVPQPLPPLQGPTQAGQAIQPANVPQQAFQPSSSPQGLPTLPKLSVTGVDGTPVPQPQPEQPLQAKKPDGFSQFMQDIGMWPKVNYSQDYLKQHPNLVDNTPRLTFSPSSNFSPTSADIKNHPELADFNPNPLTPAQQEAERIKFISQSSTGELLKQRYGDNPITKTADFLFSPLDPLTRDISDIAETYKIKDKVASGEIDSSVFDGIEALHKSIPQVVGDVMQAVLVPYTLETGGEVIAKNALQKSLSELAVIGAKSGGFAGFQFGVAQALSSGSTNPDDITKMIVANTAGGVVLGSA